MRIDKQGLTGDTGQALFHWLFLALYFLGRSPPS